MKCLAIALSVFVLACGDSSAAVEAELQSQLEASPTVYHFGCVIDSDNAGLDAPPPRGDVIPCGDGRWRCGQDALDQLRATWADLPAGGQVTVTWMSPFTFAGPFFVAYVIDADGSATRYYEKKTDIADDDCGDYCGWHHDHVAEAMQSDGTPIIRPSGADVVDFELCDWP